MTVMLQLFIRALDLGNRQLFIGLLVGQLSMCSLIAFHNFDVFILDNFFDTMVFLFQLHKIGVNKLYTLSAVNLLSTHKLSECSKTSGIRRDMERLNWKLKDNYALMFFTYHNSIRECTTQMQK